MFLKTGKIYTVQTGNYDSVDVLPVNNYILAKDAMGNLFLEESEAFKSAGKMYGSIDNRSDRILKTFKDRRNSTGVLLAGIKGSGKSLLARNICIKSNLPVIIINSELFGDGFNNIIESIQQECIILFDEFEKTYRKEAQQALLTILDGVIQTKKLFIFTSNNKYALDTNMMNRPGRIYYSITYNKIDFETVKQYVEENLHNQDYAKDIYNIFEFFEEFNFDTMKAIVEESNRYNESPITSLEMLNVEQVNSFTRDYDCEFYKGDKLLFTEEHSLRIDMSFYERFYNKAFLTEDDVNSDDDDDNDSGCLTVKYSDMVSKTIESLTFITKDGYKVIFKYKKYTIPVIKYTV